MSAPDVPRDMFLELVTRSRVLDPGHLGRVATQFPTATAKQLADALIRAGDLTHFQATRLLRGRWQGLAVGPYRLLAPLGRGGMGTVFLARDCRLAEELGDQVLVALKLLPPRVARDDERMLVRFRREIELGSRVNHPNVARTQAGGEADGVNFIAMEFVPGKTVRQIVSHAGRLTVGEAAGVFADVAAGLGHIHERGLIHRDLKPSNIMITPDGHAKLLDLGLSIVAGEVSPDDPSVVGGKGYILGTMDYISPEQASDATAVTPRSDLYSLGCSLYFALTGTPPFPGGTAKDKIRRQRTLDPVPLCELNPEVPPAFAQVVSRLMAKKPGDRPASAAAARELLLPFAATPAGSARVTVRDVLGAVDSPDAHPELWSDEDGEPELLPPIPAVVSPRSHGVIALGVAAGIVALIVLLELLRRMW